MHRPAWTHAIVLLSLPCVVGWLGPCADEPHRPLAAGVSVTVIADGPDASGHASSLWVSLEPCANYAPIDATIAGAPLRGGRVAPGYGCTGLGLDEATAPELFAGTEDELTLEFWDRETRIRVRLENVLRPPSIAWVAPSDGRLVPGESATLRMFPASFPSASNVDGGYAAFAYVTPDGVQQAFTFTPDVSRDASNPLLPFWVPASLPQGPVTLYVYPTTHATVLDAPRPPDPVRGEWHYAVLECVGAVKCEVMRGQLGGLDGAATIAAEVQ